MLLNLAVNLDRSRYQVEVVSLYGSAKTRVEAELAEAGIPVTYLGKRLGFDASMIRRIHRAFRAKRPDIVHTHRAVLQYALPALTLWRGRRVVHTVHNLAPLELPQWGRLAHRLAFALGATPVAIGAVVAASFRAVYGHEPRATIPNGIPVRSYAAPKVGRAEWRRREVIGEHRFLLVTAARLQVQKNVPLLLRAMKRMGAAGDPIVAIAGDGPLRRELEGLSSALGIADRVRFLGARDDVPDLLGAADAFVLSSDWEGNPLCLMEAMAAGLPVLATNVGGVPEIVIDGVTGILVPPDDEAHLASAMRLLADDPARCLEISRAARERAVAEFDVSVMARRYAALYEELLAGDGER